MNFDQWRWEMRGLLMEKLRRPRDAIAAYERAYALYPANLRYAHIIGFLHAQQNDFAKADAWLAKVCELEPNNGEAWFILGFVRDKAQRWAEPIEAFQKAVEPVYDWFNANIAGGKPYYEQVRAALKK